MFYNCTSGLFTFPVFIRLCLIINHSKIRIFMKKFITSVLLAACAQVMAAATITDNGDGKYTIQNDKVTMTVSKEGGKILSFKYGDAEVISQTTFPNSFGSTFWTSPQKEWNWPPVPEFDRMPYQVTAGDNLVMTSEVSGRLKYQIRKEFTVDPADKAIVVTYSIINKSEETRKVAPWEITRVPNDGIIFFDAPIEDITPAGLMDFKPAFGLSWYTADEAQQNRKINADGKGWLAFSAKGLLMVKKFQDLDKSQPAPEEAEIQVYVNQRKTFIELESQGAYTTLKPGEEFSWTVRWYLLPCDDNAQPSEALKQKVLKAIKGS